MNDVSDWLDRRRPGMPRELRRAVDAALGGVGSDGAHDDVAVLLAEAALAALARVARAAPERGTAAELLAADALLTYACEAAAELGPESLDRLTAGLDHARFAALLEPSVS